jgi:DNA-binding SARP family transcriptional activator
MGNDSAADLVGNELVRLGIKTDVDFFAAFAARSAAYRHYSTGRTKSALTMLNHAIKGFETEETPVLAAAARLCSLLWRVSDEYDKEKTYREACALLTPIPRLYPGSCYYEICQSLFGAIARECGKVREAEAAFLLSSGSSERKGAKHILCGTLLHLTKLYLDEGMPEKAEPLLVKAMSIASAQNYSIFWDIHLGTMSRVLVYCIKLGIYAGYAEKMLAQYFSAEAAAYAIKRLSSVRQDQVKDFSDRLYLRYSAAEKDKPSDRIQMQFFGRFKVIVNGNEIPADRWKTKKVRGLFQYLVYHKGSVVTREHLMELFWPEAGRKNAAMSLNTALYDLKKILKDLKIATDSMSGLIKENSDGLFINPDHQLDLDIDAFRNAYNDLKKLKKNHAEKTQIKKVLQQMVELYSDGFFCDVDWLLGEKEEFDQIFIEISETLALLHSEDHEYIQAETLLIKALELDPYNEELCLNVLNLFVLTGARTRAITYFQAFEKRLIEELDVMPGYRLQEFMKGVRNNAPTDR